MKYAVIIKHLYGDFGYRVDIVDVADDTNPSDIRKVIEGEILGPFEVLAITPELNLSRDISKGLERIARESENHVKS